MAHGQKYDEQTLTVGQAVTRPATDPAAEEAEPEGEEAQGENEPETSEEPAADPESNAQQAETEQLRDLLTYIASDRVDGAPSRIIDGEVVRVREDVQWRDEHMAWESVVADERYEAREEGREERNAELLEFLRLRGAEAVIQALRAAGESED